MKLSVIMAVFNGARFLDEALASIRAQTFRDFECVVVDDGSTDGTRQLLERQRSQDARFRIIRQPHSGLVFALNRACAVARGEYIARMDADDVAAPRRLERQLQHLERRARLGLLGTAMELIDECGRVVGAVDCPEGRESTGSALLTANCFSHPTVMLRREALTRVGAYRAVFRHAEDYDLWLRIADHYEVANLDDRLLAYRIHGDQISVQHLHDQAVSAIGARVAARIRRSTGVDPADRWADLAAETLRAEGVAEREITEAVLKSAMIWTTRFVVAGKESVAERLLKDIGALENITLARVAEYSLCRVPRERLCETLIFFIRLLAEGRSAQRQTKALMYWWGTAAAWRHHHWRLGACWLARAMRTDPRVIARLGLFVRARWCQVMPGNPRAS